MPARRKGDGTVHMKAKYANQFTKTLANKKRRLEKHIKKNPGDLQAKAAQ